MLIYLIIVVILIAIAVTCDFTPYTLSEDEVKLLYSDEVEATTDDTSIFGTSTITGDINTEDISSSSAKAQAEELLNQIYNG